LFDGYVHDGVGSEDNSGDDSGGDGVSGGVGGVEDICDDDSGDVGGGDDIADNDSGGDEFDGSNFLGQLLRHTKAELLIGSTKGVENFEAVNKSAEKNVYKRSKGCLKHWTVLRFIFELLILKA